MEFEVDDTVQYYGVVKSTKRLVTLIKAMHINAETNFHIDVDGITLTMEKQRAVRAHMNLPLHHFYEFHYGFSRPAMIPVFRLQVEALVDSLRAMMPPTITTSNNAPDSTHDYCEMSYDGTGSLLKLKRKIQEHGMISQFSLKPSEAETDTPDLLVSDTLEAPPQTMSLDPRWFKDAIEGFNNTTEKVTMTISPSDEVSFLMTAEGTEVTTEEELEKGTLHISAFSCDRELTNTYLYSHIILCKKALAYSDSVRFEFFDNGCLRLLFQLAGPNNTNDFIEFSFLPSISDA